jgi:heme exporter protein B
MAQGSGAAFAALVVRDLRLGLARRGELFNPLFFFVLVVTLFPLGVGPDPSVLRLLAPGVVWVAALLATLLSAERMFRSDFEDGSLEQLLLGPQPLALLVFAKTLAHWLLTGVPLTLLAPLLGALLHLPAEALGTLCLSALLGTPVLSLVAAIGVALTVGLRRGGLLLALIILPLYIPVLIFATSAVAATAMGLPAHGQFAMLGAFLALALGLAPLATGAALRISGG